MYPKTAAKFGMIEQRYHGDRLVEGIRLLGGWVGVNAVSPFEDGGDAGLVVGRRDAVS